MNFIERALSNLVMKKADETVQVKVDDILDSIWGVKPKEYVKMNDGSYAVLFENGKIVDREEFITRELSRQLKRDINYKRALLGLGTFYVVGKTFIFVEGRVKGG